VWLFDDVQWDPLSLFAIRIRAQVGESKNQSWEQNVQSDSKDKHNQEKQLFRHQMSVLVQLSIFSFFPMI